MDGEPYVPEGPQAPSEHGSCNARTLGCVLSQCLLLQTLLQCFLLLGLGSPLPHLAPCWSQPTGAREGPSKAGEGRVGWLLHPGEVKCAAVVSCGLQFLQHLESQPHCSTSEMPTCAKKMLCLPVFYMVRIPACSLFPFCVVLCCVVF